MEESIFKSPSLSGDKMSQDPRQEGIFNIKQQICVSDFANIGVVVSVSGYKFYLESKLKHKALA